MAPSATGSRWERLCAADDDARTLRLRLLAELRRTVGFDYYAWVLTDPVTTVGCAPLAATPDVADLPRLIRLRYLTALSRWTTLTDVGSLHRATGGELGRSLLWRELLSGYGVRGAARRLGRLP